MGELSNYSDKELLQIVHADIEYELKSRGFRYGWYKDNPFAGDIYILTNPAFPNLVKIGYADDVEKRVRQLNRNSGLPDPFHVYACYNVRKRLEDLRLHALIDSLNPTLRHSANREFYEMTPEKAYGILSAIAQINGDEDCLFLNPFEDAYFQNRAEESLTTENKKRKSPTRQEKPEKIVFKNGGQMEFSTWRDFESQVCQKIIETYRLEEFKTYVLEEKRFHSKKKNMFGLDPELMKDYRETQYEGRPTGILMNTNNSAETVRGICERLTGKFPEAGYELVYPATSS